MRRPSALVTGASSGIGERLARLAARDSHDLVLVARRVQRLEDLAARLRADFGVDVLVAAADLALPGAAPDLLARLGVRTGAIEVLVNCAGFGDCGAVAELAEERQRQMLELNVLALTTLTRLLLPPMIARRRGAILNVASTAAFQPGPGMAVYSASKAYVLSFSEALHEELRGSGVSVSCLCPGPTATGFAEAAHMRDVRFLRLGSADADAVAAAAWQALRANRALLVPGLLNRLHAFLVRLGPRWLTRRIAAWLLAAG